MSSTGNNEPQALRGIMRNMLLAGASLASLCAFAPAASAQAAPAAADEATASTAGGIEEITVTARRRTESLQDTPIAISAVTGEGIAERGIDNVTQIGDFTPNVKFNSSVPVSASNATAAIFIRGIGQQDPVWSFEPGVGLYIDDVYMARPQGAVLERPSV